MQEYLSAWQLANCNNGDTCERIFCRACFNPTLAEMEVLPMTLGLVVEPDKLYEALEQLPESLDFKGLPVRARGLAYLKSLNQNHLTEMACWFGELLRKEATAKVCGSWSKLHTVKRCCADWLNARC
ncbi:MAG: hypothetical protein ABIU20_07840 [Blastocatellia bacterium]